MRRLMPVAVITLLFVLVAPLSTAAQPTGAPPGPTTRHLTRTDGLPISGPYEIINFVLDFAPGAQTPVHHHGGQVFVTVIEGEVTFQHDGVDTVYGAGETFVEPPGSVGKARNAGTVPAAVFATALLPVGAALTTPVGQADPNPPPAPVTRWLYRTPGWQQTAPFEIVHLVLDFAPGASTPPHSHGGVLPFTTYAGRMTFRVSDHDEVAMPAGTSFTEHPGHVGIASNETSEIATVVGSVVLPKGNAITYVVPSMDCSWFPEVKQSLCFGFRAYWERYGGLAVFGYPITPEFKNDAGVTVQWFERARFEWHPGSWPERNDVMLGRIGAELVELTSVGPTP